MAATLSGFHGDRTPIKKIIKKCRPRSHNGRIILHWFEIWCLHDDTMTWKHFPHYWPFVMGIHQSLVHSLHKGAVTETMLWIYRKNVKEIRYQVLPYWQGLKWQFYCESSKIIRLYQTNLTNKMQLKANVYCQTRMKHNIKDTLYLSICVTQCKKLSNEAGDNFNHFLVNLFKKMNKHKFVFSIIPQHRNGTVTCGTLFIKHCTISPSQLAHWPPGKFERKFRHVIFKQILVIDGWGISCEIALLWMSLDFTDDESTLVQVMAWCRQAPSHYLSQCWPRYLSPYGVIKLQWVNTMACIARASATMVKTISWDIPVSGPEGMIKYLNVQ